MPKIKQQPNGAWCVISDCGGVVKSDLTNAQAWRYADKMSGEPVSLSEGSKEFKEVLPELSDREIQDFYSGLIQIGIDRGYEYGWAWHKFHERFKYGPDGLSNVPRKPSKSVWGWVNRKAIAAIKGRRK